MSIVYLIRHGTTEYNLEHRLHGHIDVKLAETGKEQLPYLADYCRTLRIQSIFSSPLSRARETAVYIAERLQLQVELDDGLKERYFGPLEGVLASDLPKILPKNMPGDIKIYPGRFVYPGVEHPLDIQQRIYNAVHRIAALEKDKTVCIVTHETTINLLLAKIWGVMDLENYRRVTIPNASVTKLKYDADGRFRCVFYGEDNFLPEGLQFSVFTK